MRCPQFRDLFSSMRKSNNKERDRFLFTFNNVEFDVIVVLDKTPFELLVGALYRNWACTMKMLPGYDVTMDDKDFFELCRILNLQAGKDSFLSSHFISYMANHCPKECSSEIVNPKHYARHMSSRKNIEDSEKTVFRGWIEQRNGRTARNYSKTEEYFGKKIADFCRERNISSVWTYPTEANYSDDIDLPPGYKP